MKQSTFFAVMANSIKNLLQGYTKGIRFLLVMLLTLTVSAEVWGVDVTFDATKDKGSTSTGAVSFEKDGITLSVENGALGNGTDYRIYKNTKLTISSSVGTITNIALTYKSASYDGGGWSASYNPNAETWTSPTASGEQARITKIVVTYTSSGGGGSTTVDPEVTFSDGEYTIGGAALDLSTLWESNSTGAVTYSVTNAGTTGATVNGTSFTATAAGTCTVQASQVATATHNAATATATITVTAPAGGGGGEGECSWKETAIGNIEDDDIVVITMTTSNGTTYAMSNNNGTGSAPAATTVTVSGSTLTGDIADNLKWNITNNTGSLTIYPNGTTSTWLYCTGTNNGVRVGTEANSAFTIDAESSYLFHNGTSRYIGVYNSQDWRCYTSINANITNQTLKFYVYTCDGGGSASTPTLTVDKPSLAFGNVATDSNKEMTFTLTGSNLTADATLALSGTNAGLFSVSPTSVTPSNGSIPDQIITVTYTPDAKASHSAILTISSTDAESIEISLSGTGVAQTADYTVNHYQQNITDDNYTLKETETPSGEVGAIVTPAVKSYTGFGTPTPKSVEITADGNAVVEYYYTRNSYNLTWDVNEGNDLTGEYTSGSVKFGATITKPDDPTRENHNFKGWKDQNGSTVVASTMPDNDLTYTAQWKVTYIVTFLNHGEEVEEVTVEAGNSVTLPTEELTSCDTEKYPHFYGWTANPIDGVGIEEPADLITENFTPNSSVTLHAVFVDQLSQEGGWQVVTSASELVAGKIYTIGSYGSPTTGTAMGTQNSNNRGTASWTTGTPVELTLGGSAGEWTLYDPIEGGYLYAASSSENYLKTQTTLNNNGRWAITISNNKAKIQAQGDKTRNIIRYNSSSKIFSCYASGQGDIQLLTKAVGTQPTAFITSCCETEAPTNGNAEVLSGTSVKLTWEGTASNYHITGGNFAAGGDDTPATSYTISGLTECETYTFNISAAPDNACESAAISVTVTPFAAKTITFVDGSTTTTLSTTCENDEIVVPTPTEQNCSTYVWKDEQGNEYAAGDEIIPTTNMTITTVWTVIPYTVTFVDYDGTTVLKESEVNCGEMPTPPADPTREANEYYEYEFSGWTPTLATVSGDATYKATYTQTQHQITVTWMVNGEEYTLGGPSTTVSAGEKVAKLPTPPSPDDYCGQVFAGWTDQPIDGAPIADAPAVLFNTPETSPTLYKEGDKTTVTFYAVFADIKE